MWQTVKKNGAIDLATLLKITKNLYDYEIFSDYGIQLYVPVANASITVYVCVVRSQK